MNFQDSLTIMPPAFDAADVATAVAAQFGLEGSFEPLVSERDQNFSLVTDAGLRFVVKVTSALESELATAFQIGALEHLGRITEIRAPEIVHTSGGGPFGTITDGETTYRLRIVTWIEGVQLETLGLDPQLMERFGVALAGLDEALKDFSHEGEDPVLLWDLQRVQELRPLLEFIDDAEIRAAVAAAIDDYRTRVVPNLPVLRTQVIHSDANPENVLMTRSGIGFIDFGDIVRAPRIFEVAIAASYLRSLDDEPLRLIAAFIAGYHAGAPLEAAETSLLFDLVRARLATTITLLYWRLRERSEGDEYQQKSQMLESTASHFLAVLDCLGRREFSRKINEICGKR
jgi:Ser/Thr protein kinase RdoA (MazF antagonist)